MTALWTLRRVGKEDKAATLAECYFDTSIGTLYIARMGLEIRDAANVCPSVNKLRLEAATAAGKALEAAQKAKESGKDANDQAEEAWHAHKDAMRKTLVSLVRGHEARGKLNETMEAFAHDWERSTSGDRTALGRRLSPRMSHAEALARAENASRHAHETLRRTRKWIAEEYLPSRPAEEARFLAGHSPEGQGSLHDFLVKAQAKAADSMQKAREAKASMREAKEAHKEAREARKEVFEAMKEQGKLMKETHDHRKEAFTEAKLAFDLAKAVPVEKRVCAADSSGILSSMFYSSAYLSAASSECALMYEQTAYCVSDITRLIASLAEMSAGSSAVAAVCTKLGRSVHTSAPGNFERRLREDGAPSLLDLLPRAPGERPHGGHPKESGKEHEKFEELKESLKEAKEKVKKVKEKHEEAIGVKVEHAECAVDTSQAVMFLGRAGMEINGGLVKGAYGPVSLAQDGTIEGFAEVATASLGSLAAFSLVSFMVSNAVDECSEHGSHLDALCAGAVSQLVAGTAELGAAIGLLDTCDPNNREVRHHEIKLERNNG